VDQSGEKMVVCLMIQGACHGKLIEALSVKSLIVCAHENSEVLLLTDRSCRGFCRVVWSIELGQSDVADDALW